MPTRFAEVDLKRPLPSLYVDARYDQVALTVFWGYLLIGVIHLPCPSRPSLFSPGQLHEVIQRVLGWQIWEFIVCGKLAQFEAFDGPLPPISVIVCTRDRPLSLARCLKSLANLEYPSYDVLVVDNGSRRPGVRAAILQSGFPWVREDRTGLNWARNRGITESKGEIVAFIDDDAVASRGWLRGLALGFRDAQIGAVTGLVLPMEIETTAQADFESYGGMSKGFTGFTIRREELSLRDRFWASRWGVGTNMAFRRTLFKAVGVFDVALDVGTPTSGGGDIEFFYRVVSAGHALRYEPAAMVRHAHRRDDSALRRQISNNGRSFTAYLLTIMRNDPHQRGAAARFLVRWWLWEWLLKRLLCSALKRDRWTFRLAWVEFRGFLAGGPAYYASRRLSRELLAKTPSASTP
jgi:glycosyltransferase involved in cell wall biosynthesis